MTAKPPIVMVHGAFCGGWAFETFRAPFEAAGHAVATPDLPGHGIGESRQAAVGLTMADYARSIAEVIASQDEPPVVIGHSLGGLVTQMAAQNCPIRALILLAPSAPWGIMGGSMEEAVSAATLYALGPFWAMSIEPDYTAARQYTFDRLGVDDRKAVVARMVPESGRALWETLNWWLDPMMTTRVNGARVGVPVLAVAGEKDLIHPPATVRQTAERLGASVRVMPGMSHWLIAEPGWREVASTCLDWPLPQRISLTAA